MLGETRPHLSLAVMAAGQPPGDVHLVSAREPTGAGPGNETEPDDDVGLGER